jgi:hypothetical protein
MKSVLKNMICRFLAIAIMMLPFQIGQAKMIGMDDLNSAVAVQADRTLVLNYLSRTGVANELSALGIDAQTATDRVAAMSDSEIAALAGKFDSAPAGGDGLIAVILVVFFIWYFAFRR